MRAALVIALLSRAALADAVHVDYPYHGLYGAVDIGVSAPLADSRFTAFADPTFKVGMHFGWELALHKYFLLAPELNLDIMPVNTDDSTFNANNAHFDATFTRVRFLVGGRFSLRFGKAEPFMRIGFGLDYIGGHVLPPIGNQRDFSTTAFSFKPALGFQYEVAKYFLVGGELAFPIGAGHNFGQVDLYFNGLTQRNNAPLQFTAADIEVALFAGFRY
jgi:opacity protein-like surface antigen